MKKKILDFVKTAFVRSCVFFTSVTILIYAGAATFAQISDSLTPERLMLVLLFSVICGVMTAFLTTNILNLPVRAVLHYAVTLASFLLLFPGLMQVSGAGKGRDAVVAAAKFTLFWVIPFVVWLVVRAVKARKEE